MRNTLKYIAIRAKKHGHKYHMFMSCFIQGRTAMLVGALVSTSKATNGERKTITILDMSNIACHKSIEGVSPEI